MSADTIVQDCLKNIPKAVAAGVVDMSSGMLLGVKTVDSHPQEVLDMVAAATRDLFEGDNVVAIEDMFKRVRGIGPNDDRYFREMIVTSTNLVHFFGRLKAQQSVVVTVVCRGDANLGLVLTKAREICASRTV